MAAHPVAARRHWSASWLRLVKGWQKRKRRRWNTVNELI